MYISELLTTHPEICGDRHRLSFSNVTPPGVVEDALHSDGAVMLRSALPPNVLRSARRAFRRFAHRLNEPRSPFDRLGSGQSGDEGPASQWSLGEGDTGSWHRPWVVRAWNRRPAAAVIMSLMDSWAWRVVERLCGSTDIAILLGFCIARHAIDEEAGVGAHQDAKVVSPEIPFSIWVPLQNVAPGHTSGLGFVVPSPPGLLPTLPHGDIGADHVLDNVAGVWVPTYRTGDMTIHAKFAPHFTASFGTKSDRYSIEIRAMARDAAPIASQDPAIYVARRNGVPTIIGTNCSAGTRAHDFLAVVAQAMPDAPPALQAKS
jgi:hypothetical protein